MAPHYVLFEHAAGYGLFRVQEFEEVATFLPQVEEAVTDVSKFSSVSLGFVPKTCALMMSTNKTGQSLVSNEKPCFLKY